jgi:hypothetical protein
MNQLILKARFFAIGAHQAINHRRKYTNDCYSHHLFEVAARVARYGGTPEMIAAAWLHDVVEDTQVTHEQIIGLFGPKVFNLVSWLTDVSKPHDGNRKRRKEIDREHLAAAPDEAQTIKYCDLIDNTKSITVHDPKFAKVYLAERDALLEVMTKGLPELRQLAQGVERLHRTSTNPIHLHIDMMRAPSYFKECIADLGIQYQRWEPQPIADQIKLVDCHNIPKTLPDWMFSEVEVR